MGLFSDVLLSVDFDRTLTAPDSTIPERNLEAIRYFMAEGGAFTVNTGRSLAMSRDFLKQVPLNAPLLVYNGGAAYDTRKEEFVFRHEIPLPQGQTLREIIRLCPGRLVELQGVSAHYVFEPNPVWESYCRRGGVRGEVVGMDDDLGPFLKLCVIEGLRDSTVDGLFHATPEELARMDQAEAALRGLFGSAATVLRVAPRTLDIVAPGVSKGKAARELQAMLGKKLLVCIGDERNDLPMLEMADYSFCPADGAVADQFPNVCPCADGAVADVIFKKIPEILKRNS
ncbi:MAG: hypothetical protein EGQ26_04475 [Clostridiales bacterium]|nr:hypothetical protein [Clostridiales bacterium]